MVRIPVSRPIDVHAPGARPGDLRLRDRRGDRRSRAAVLGGHPARRARGDRAARAAAHPHPPRPRRRHGRALPPLPGAHGLRARARRAPSHRPVEAAEERRSALRRRHGELWGEVAPVPEERITALPGGETVEGFRVAYTPGHASHHVSYLHEETGDAYVGDVAGVRIPPSDYTCAPTPPPDIDVEAWLRLAGHDRGWNPQSLCLTHFGRVTDVHGAHRRACAALLGARRAGADGRRGALRRPARGASCAERSDPARRGASSRPRRPTSSTGARALLAQGGGERG